MTSSSGHDGDDNAPRIQFLYFEGCPHAPAALAMLRDVLQAEGIASAIEMIAVETDEAAQQYRFFGSPTIRISGEDVGAPSSSAAPSLACRLYPQPDGSFAPHPPVEAVVQALHRARGHTGA